MPKSDDEKQRQVVDNHIIKTLSEIRGGQQGPISRNDFVDKVLRRVTKDIGPGFPVRDRIDEILDSFMSRDDGA